MKTLRELYNLPYDETGFRSGLIQWYNAVIDKNVDELDVADISRMIRQNILTDIAINKAIELFLCNPYDGEYKDGALLSLLLTIDTSQINKSKLNELNKLLQLLNNEHKEYDWENNEAKEQYSQNLSAFETKIAMEWYHKNAVAKHPKRIDRKSVV